MTSVDYVVLTIGIPLIVGGVIALPLFCQWLIRFMHQSWRKSEGGGCAYNPLQEIIQPQIRHVVEAPEQRRVEDESGGPPAER